MDVVRLQRQVLLVGLVDFALLVVLVFFAFVSRSDAMVSILGPIHGVGFLLLLGMTGYGASLKAWGWWFPAIVLVTGGPVGTLVGEYVLRRRLTTS